MPEKKLTIKEFAEILNVSTATVSRALNRKGRVSLSTAEFIRARADELGYRANIYASRFRTKKSGTVGFFYPLFSDGDPGYFISEIMTGINSEAAISGKALQIFLMSDTPENRKLYFDSILNGSLEGIIVTAGMQISGELAIAADKAGFPCVTIGGAKGIEANCIILDNERGAMLAGRYFKNTGRKNPAYIGGFLDRKKKKGFSEGLADSGEKVFFGEGGCSFEDGHAAFR